MTSICIPTLAFLCVSGTLLPAQEAKYALQPAWPNLTVKRPVALVIPPDGSGRQFLVEQRGRIEILPSDENADKGTTFLDFSGREMEAPDGDFEEGLLGMAFHPQFAQNRKFYVYYTLQNMKRALLSEMQVSAANPNQADEATERVLMEIPEPFWNHNSGNLAFGPDGFLYVAVGDGGKAHDVIRAAQNPFMLLGKILRIDVNATQGSRAYAVPKDNPFVGVAGTRDEIWALGLRNPWGMAFDADGTLWCADVGQDLWEEINLIQKGGNYGWSFREGNQKFPLRNDAPPEDSKFIDPIHVYTRNDGISITGGFIYRGKKIPALQGAYLYGDWGTGRTWALRYDKTAKKVTSNELVHHSTGDAQVKPTAYCEDVQQEVVVLDWSNKLWRLTAK